MPGQILGDERALFEANTTCSTIKGMEGAIAAKTVTYDFERQLEGAKLLKCSEFGDAIIKHM